MRKTFGKPQPLEFREKVLQDLGASPEICAELLEYNRNVFQHPHSQPGFPLHDEPHVQRWRFYLTEAEKSNIFDVLAQRLPQFAFPIEAGMRDREDYRAATRRGIPVTELATATGLKLQAPQSIRLHIHPTPAGHIPILTLPHRADFEDLDRAILKGSEPGPVPQSMGAVLIVGFNNWDRIQDHRQSWERQNPDGFWAVEFQELIKNKPAYQDSFIILSEGPYSGVPASELGLDHQEWLRLSYIIRREHECAHYFTRRLFASMRNNIIDEILADYRGIVAANGDYRADWFLHFVGLEAYPHYHQGRRLENYRDSLSDEAFEVLQKLTFSAAHNLEAFDREHGPRLRSDQACGYFLAALTQLTLEELASPDGPELLGACWQSFLLKSATSG